MRGLDELSRRMRRALGHFGERVLPAAELCRAADEVDLDDGPEVAAAARKLRALLSSCALYEAKMVARMPILENGTRPLIRSTFLITA